MPPKRSHARTPPQSSRFADSALLVLSARSESLSLSHSAYAIQTLPTPLNNLRTTASPFRPSIEKKFDGASRANACHVACRSARHGQLVHKSRAARWASSHPRPCPQALGMPQFPLPARKSTRQKKASTGGSRSPNAGRLASEISNSDAGGAPLAHGKGSGRPMQATFTRCWGVVRDVSVVIGA
jgi:hypothetical protein